MASANPKFLDLDAVVPEVDFTIKLDGTIHKLEPTTVETFVAQTKRLENLNRSATTADELEIVIEMLKTAFPTVLEARWRKLTLAQLKKLNDFALAEGGHDEVAKEAAQEAEANPQ